jgi:hypothetical protein
MTRFIESISILDRVWGAVRAILMGMGWVRFGGGGIDVGIRSGVSGIDRMLISIESDPNVADDTP